MIKSDDVTVAKLPSAPPIDLTVHAHVSVENRFFGVATRIEEAGELQKLSEADDVAANRHIFDGCGCGHTQNAIRHLRTFESRKSRDTGGVGV